MQVIAAITVRRDRDELYALWRNFERFPDFMAHLEEVRSTGPNASHWKARGPLGTTVEWDAQITEDVPGERVAWRSVEGSKIDNAGTVRFVQAPGDQGTELHVEMSYSPPAGAVGATIAKLFGEEPGTQLKDDLRRFKAIAETAEKLWGDATCGIFGYSHATGGYAGGQAEYARVPFADVGPIKIESGLPDEQVLFLSDVFPTGYMGAEVCDIRPGDIVAVWGCGPVGQFAIASAYLLGPSA